MLVIPAASLELECKDGLPTELQIFHSAFKSIIARKAGREKSINRQASTGMSAWLAGKRLTWRFRKRNSEFVDLA
jgi:hypothetical protein